MADTIMVIEDSPENIAFLQELLAFDGYKVVTSEGASEAMSMLDDWHPDLILLDINMPGISGFELCSILKEDAKTAQIPIIFLTGRGDPGDKVQGLKLGAVDYITKPFDIEETLARVRTQLKLCQLNQSLLEANSALLKEQREREKDLRAAAVIQKALIPRSLPKPMGLSFAWQFKPCDMVGGDIFNVLPLNDREVVVYMIDVSGHGVSAAMVTFSVAQALHAEIEILFDEGNEKSAHRKAPSPSCLLEALENEFPMERFDRFFTICYLVIDLQTGQLRYSSAGHPPPVLLRKGGGLEFLAAGGPPIGLGLGERFEEGAINLRHGDRLYLYTDGVFECGNKRGEIFTRERFYVHLEDAWPSTIEESCQTVVESLDAFSDGMGQQDDITLLSIEYLVPCKP
jgi:sigma-B regulation protein RsbU (phosphoserine phosphatase)